MQTTVSSFTCLPSAITVGNYYNRSTYTDVSGTLRTFNHAPGQISVNSSLGPNRNNFLKPDISSAGDIMFGTGRLATLASAINSNPSKVSSDSLHWRNGGTSMASPTVAGMVALYLQMCPKANNNQIKSDLIASAKKDQFTGLQPNFTFGNGKADGFQYLKRRVFYPLIPVSNPIFCQGDSSILTIAPSFSSYQWNTSPIDSTNSITVHQGGNYYAWVENQFGCSVTSEIASLIFYRTPQQPIIQQNALTLTINDVGSYQWFQNQSSIPWAENPSHIALSSGDYYCEYTDVFGCSTNSDTVTIIVTSLEEISTQSFNIQPNPSRGLITINLSADQHANKIEVLNPQGKLVWLKIIQESRQQFELDLSLLSKGFYFMRVSTSNNQILRKIILE
ncbi:MAG: S8 family peptidase [Flavobacteriales bacterium]|nr:S8 family peptidase [Flavobacteriales bacterium]